MDQSPTLVMSIDVCCRLYFVKTSRFWRCPRTRIFLQRRGTSTPSTTIVRSFSWFLPQLLPPTIMKRMTMTRQFMVVFQPFSPTRCGCTLMQLGPIVRSRFTLMQRGPQLWSYTFWAMLRSKHRWCTHLLTITTTSFKCQTTDDEHLHGILFTLHKTYGLRFPFSKQHQGFSSPFRRLKGFTFPFPRYHGASDVVSHYQDSRVPLNHESNHQGFRFPVSKVHSYIHKVPLHLRPNVGVSAAVFAFFKTLGFTFTMKSITKGFGFPVSKLHFISSYPDIYTTKTSAPMKKSWKGNIVDTNLFHHWISKVLQRQHRRSSSWSKVRVSIAYFTWGRVIICFLYFHIFICTIWAIIGMISNLYVISVRFYHITGQILPVHLHVTYHTSHFSLLIFIPQQCFLTWPISHGGEWLSIW